MFFVNIFIKIHTKYTILGPKLMFAECDKHYPIRSGQTTLAKAETFFTKPVTRINFGPSTLRQEGAQRCTFLVRSSGKED